MVLVLLLGSAAVLGVRARLRKEKEARTPGPMLDQGFLDLDTPAISLRLVRSSQTVAALKPRGAGKFTPGDLLVERSRDGYYHLGDIDLRLRQGTSGEWKSYSTAVARKSVEALPTSAQILAAADLSATLPADIPLQITRAWGLEQGKLALHIGRHRESDRFYRVEEGVEVSVRGRAGLGGERSGRRRVSPPDR